jgi:hypothetical protein
LIDDSICEYERVSLYREKSKWGSKINKNSNIEISIMYDKEKFLKTLLEIE